MQYEAGSGTGFQVKTGHPDSDPFGGVFYNGPPGKPGGRPRGHTSVVMGKDGSYGFTSSGPDQRRTETSDANGRVKGSYTYVDDKGVQRTVQYVAGPNIGYRIINNAAAGGAVSSGITIPPLLPSIVPPSILPPASLNTPSSLPSLLPSEFEQNLQFGPPSSTTATALPDHRRPASTTSPVKGFGSGGNNSGGGGGSGGNGGSGETGNTESDDFLAPNSNVPLGSAFPEDDPSQPPKKWTNIYQNKDEEAFFRPFEKFNKHREQNNTPHKKPIAVPDTPSYGQTAAPGNTGQSSFGYFHPSSTTSRPSAPPDTLYGQPSRPIVVDDKYGQYGGTDYQKPKHPEFVSGHDADNNYGRFPPGTIVKAHVQNLDILPFGHRVPSPSYVLEKQYGNNDGYQNAIKK